MILSRLSAHSLPRLASWLAPLLLAACAGTTVVPEDSTPSVQRGTTPPRATASVPPRPTPPATSTKRGGGYYKDDGPGEAPPPEDLAAIPDAEPRAEPLLASANRPYTALGQSFVPMQQVQPYAKRGVASWYGRKFHGQKTSSGEPYDMYGMTGAHPTLPIPSYARVTNVSNGRTVIVRINDRGPFVASRVIDLSYTAAWKLGYADRGSTEVMVEAIVPDEMEMVLASVDKPAARAIRTPSLSKTPAPPLVPAPMVNAETPTPLAVAEAPPPAASEERGSSSGVFLQLGAFASQANADSFRDYVMHELKWLNQTISSQFGGNKYRLNVGPFASVAEARDIAERIAQTIKLKPFVVTR